MSSMLSKVKKAIPPALYRSMRLWAKRGTRYTCPFCEYSSDELALVGFDLPVLKEKQVIGAGRRHGGCLKCGSSDRERLVYIYLREIEGIFRGDRAKRILHIAPESRLSKVLSAHGFGEYVQGDLFAEGYVYPEEVKNVDLMAIPYAEGYFDLVICNHVLEHVPDDRIAMGEILRVLRKGGLAILQVPISATMERTIEDPSVTDPAERERRFGQHDHVRLYGQDYVQRLERAGFQVTAADLNVQFGKFAFDPAERIFAARRP